mmetsp:Transcript_34980/g.91863  ORF Transcript_34980/g.91863 Transcript_34980/m.91863 type:complete len:344 (+) Transcript_34980:31-1062(+)
MVHLSRARMIVSATLWLPAIAALDLRHRGSVDSRGRTLRCASTAESLTLDELRVRLRAEWRSRFERADPNALGGCASSEWASRSLHATRLSEIDLDRCYLAPSLIPGAGRGVFAREDVPKGSLLTLYPGDAIRIDAILTGYNYVSCVCTDVDGSLTLPDPSLLARARTYEIEVAVPVDPTLRAGPQAGALPLSSVLGDPEKADDSAYIGHMLNDGAICPSEAMRAPYASESARARNARPELVEGCHLAIVATRDVRRDEELLLTYGPAYWLAQLNAARPADAVPDDEWDGDGGAVGSGRRWRGAGDYEDWAGGTGRRPRQRQKAQTHRRRKVRRVPEEEEEEW